MDQLGRQLPYEANRIGNDEVGTSTPAFPVSGTSFDQARSGLEGLEEPVLGRP